MTNTFDFKEVWEAQYEISHYLAPVYKAIADESMRGDLNQGKRLHRTAVGDFIVNSMGTTGAYSPQNWTEGDEYLEITEAREVSVTMKAQDLYMTHLPNAVKRAEKTMNRLFNWIDGDVFKVAQQNAGTAMDQSYLSGQVGDVGVPITISQANVPNVFSLADAVLIRNNVDYTPTGKWTGQYKIDKTMNVPVFIMDSNVYNNLVLYLGGKVTELGDRVSQSGNVGQFMGFNCFVSNALPFTVQLQLPTQPTDGDTVTFLYGVTKTAMNSSGVISATAMAITFTFKTTLGVTAGNVLIGASAVTAAANLAAALSAPYTSTAQLAPFTQTSLATMQQQFFNGVTATVNATTTTSVDIIVQGMGNIPLSATLTAGGNMFANPAVHCIAGVSRSISLVMPRMAEITSRPTPAYTVSTDFIAWTYWGRKVFADQAPCIIDVPISTTPFTSMANTTSL